MLGGWFLTYYNKGYAISRAIGEVEALTDCPLVTLSRIDLGLTLSINPVCIGQSLLIPKLICDEVRGVTVPLSYVQEGSKSIE